MTVTFILTLSILLQFAAAFMAFRLIPLTGRRLAWSLISAALMFMALRRCIPVIRMLSGDTMIRPDLDAELMALGISLLMVIGISKIAPIFTERKQAEEALQESEDRYRKVADFTYAWEYWRTPDGKYVYVSPACERISGYRVEEFQQDQNLLEKIIHPDDRHRFDCHISDVLPDKSDFCTLEFRIITRSDEDRWIGHECQEVYGRDGTYLGRRGSNRDITERKRAEDSLHEGQQQLKAILNNIPYIAWLKDKESRFIAANEPFGKSCGFEPEDLVGKTDLDIWPGDLAEMYRADDKEVMESGLRKQVEEPLTDIEGNTLWIETIKTPIYDEYGNLIGTAGIARDITKRKQAEEQLQHTLENLRKAFGTTVQVMVSAVETRDPYTAGHQTRSADLARAIATEMGLPQDRIDGIRMAGVIHDIGKLSIPAEILSKPSKLSEIEFSLIKEHSRSGYEILKNVESPWPLAEIVYQHHERMDGSGYPRNLKGDEIIMEARIMAVADVVESMASHRPYRPGLGIDAALEEIEKNRGTLYDNAVADACLRLFREKGYQLKRALF